MGGNWIVRRWDSLRGGSAAQLARCQVTIDDGDEFRLASG